MSPTPEFEPTTQTLGKSGTINRSIYTVTELNEAARNVLEKELGMVSVAGEISNLARPGSGHIYFSLKDGGAQVRCAMFRNRAGRLDFNPDNGLGVLVRGRVSLYTTRGDYQLIIDSIEAEGAGLLRLQFEQLKTRLLEEGLFGQEYKREIPTWPRAVGIVTSPSGAAVRDIVTVLKRRCPSIPVIIYPTRVQGPGAAMEIARAILCANQRAECDVLIVGRGGGSLEDLWSFNEEFVARAIFESTIPVVSAIGHEIDFTIADMVADLRAPTPSAAAELVSPDVIAAVHRIKLLMRRLTTNINRALSSHRSELRRHHARLISPGRRLETSYQRIDELSQRFELAARVQLNLQRGRLHTLTAQVASHSPTAKLRLAASNLLHISARLQKTIRQQIAVQTQQLEHFENILRALGPTATLARGYAIVTDKNGKIVRHSLQVGRGDDLQTRLARGRITSRVLETKPDDS